MIASDIKIRMLVSYFFFYRQSYRFPDGKSIIEQPVSLVSAFNFMSNLCYEHEKIKPVK